MSDLTVPGGPIDLYDRGLPRPTPPKGNCERCQAAKVDVGGRFCTPCYTFLEVKHQYERETRAYLLDFCQNAEDAAKAKYDRLKLAPPKNPERTIEVKARPVVEVLALPVGGDGEKS